MLEYNRFVKKKINKLARKILLIIPALCIIFLMSQTALAKSTYLINDGGRVLLHSTYATDPATILNEAGLPLGEEDTYTTQEGSDFLEIRVQRKQLVTVLHKGRTIYATTYGESVGSLLSRLNLILEAEDILSVPHDTATYDGMVLTISKTGKTEETYTVAIPYETVYCYDASLPEGEEVVLTPGVDGQLLCTAVVNYLDGKEVSRTILSEDVIRQPVNAVVARGTYVDEPEQVPMPTEPKPTQPPVPQPKPTEPAPTQPKPTQPNVPSLPEGLGMPTEGDGFITTSTGEVLKIKGKMTVKATAYSCNGEPGITYSGTPARVGAVASDPSVIPLGTKMYVVSNDGAYIYGTCVAEDIGGAIKGNMLDLYFNTFDECWIFGIRECTVYFLE